MNTWKERLAATEQQQAQQHQQQHQKNRVDQLPDISSGRIVRVSEALSPTLCGQWLRVYGRMTLYDIEHEYFNLEDGGATLVVNTSLLGDIQPTLRSWYMVIGEMVLAPSEQNQVVMQARVMSCVDGLSMRLFWEAVDVRRQFLLTS